MSIIHFASNAGAWPWAKEAVAAKEASLSSAAQLLAVHRIARGEMASSPAALLVWQGPPEGLTSSRTYAQVSDILIVMAKEGVCSEVWACALADVVRLAEVLASQVCDSDVCGKTLTPIFTSWYAIGFHVIA